MVNREIDAEEGPELQIASQRADRKWRRALWVGYGTAILVHLVLLLVSRTTSLPSRPFSAAGPRMGDVRAAAGGGQGLEMVEVRPQRAPPEQPAPEPVPVPVPVPREVVITPREVRTQPVEEAATTAPASMPGTGLPGTGGQEGTRTGAGTSTGTGRGGGGSEETGSSGLIAPRPRGIFIPPAGRPASARGQEITVWVFVMPSGRVAADSTRLEPATSDSRYNQRLRRTVAEYVFEPARRDGSPVGAWFPFQIIL